MPQASNWESALGPKPATLSWADMQTIQNNAYDRDQKRGLDELFSSNIDEKGNLNERSFYQGVAQRGLNPEAAREAMKYYQDQKAADLATQQKNQQLRMYGADPTAGGRNNASIGTPAPILQTWWDRLKTKAKSEPTPGSDIVARRQEDIQSPEFSGMSTGGQPSTVAAPAVSTGDQTVVPSQRSQEEIDADRRYALAKFLGMDKYTKLMQENPEIVNMIADSQASQEPSAVAAPANEMAVENAYNPTGSGNNTGSFTLPEDTTRYPSAITPGVDNRTHAQMVEDSYDPSKSMMDPRNMMAGAGYDADQNGDMFKWEPTNVDGQQYQQFASALKTQLNAAGYSDAPSYLKGVYDSTFQANMPPAPNNLLLSQGLEGQAKYGQEVQAYQAGLIKAKGEATKAVIAAKDKLAEFAKGYGDQTVEQRKSELGPNEILRDPSKRNEAAALKTNRQTVAFAAEAVKEAGTDTSKLALAAPQVIRAYATANNPGQQLSEGNLLESSKQLFPEYSDNKGFMLKATLALARGLRSNDWSGMDQLMNVVDASAPAALQARLARLASEAGKLNEINYSNYVITNKKEESNPDKSPSSNKPSSDNAAPAADKVKPKMDGKKVIDHIKKKTNSNNSSSARKQGESTADYIKRIRGQ